MEEKQKNELAIRTAEEGNNYLEIANRLQIVNAIAEEQAIGVLERIAETRKMVEAQRKIMTQPLMASKKEIDDFFKRIISPIEGADTILRTKVLEYRKDTPEGKGKVRHDWYYEVVTLAQVPTDYLTVDDRKIKALIQSGIREIPGIRIFQSPTLVVGGPDWGKP